MLKSTEHESKAHKIYNAEIKVKNLAFKLSDVVFIMLIRLMLKCQQLYQVDK